MIYCGEPIDNIPYHLTIPQFLLDSHHLERPLRKGQIPWIVDDSTGRSYGIEEVRARVAGLANSLYNEYGIRNNDIICFFSPNHIDYPTAIWAAHRLGAVVSTANPSYTTEELERQLQKTPPKLLLSHPSVATVVKTAAQKVGLLEDRIIMFTDASLVMENTTDDLIAKGLASSKTFVEPRLSPGEAKTKLAFFCFSSGTTSIPKAVAISHGSVITNVLQMAQFHRTGEYHPIPGDKKRFRVGDVACCVLPLYHAYGLIVNLHLLLFSGLTIVISPKFVFENFLQSIMRHKITHLLTVPPMVVLLCKHPATRRYDLSKIRYLVTGAAPSSPELIAELRKVLPSAEIGEAFGTTETATCVTFFPLDQRFGISGSAGKLIPGIEVKLLKEDGALASYGETGELVVKSPSNASGYYGNLEAWVYTGDEVRFDNNGQMFVVDRIKEIFKCKGFQVAPAELEGHLLSHPDVGDVGVIGIPHPYAGEVPLAYVALSASALARWNAKGRDPTEGEHMKQSISQHVAQSLAPWKHLVGGIIFVDTIPKNPSGKILRRLLRDQYKATAGVVEMKSRL